MHDLWDKFFCWVGFHDYVTEYCSAPFVFWIVGKEVIVSGKAERCRRCSALFFTYKDWPRVECRHDERPRPGSTKLRRMDALVVI